VSGYISGAFKKINCSLQGCLQNSGLLYDDHEVGQVAIPAQIRIPEKFLDVPSQRLYLSQFPSSLPGMPSATKYSPLLTAQACKLHPFIVNSD
jgi:hypothetical protein